MDKHIQKSLHEEIFHHNYTDPHKRGSGLSDFILGAQDGLVNVLGVVLGIAAATNDERVVLVAGLATTFAESISMGAVAFTTTLADADLYILEMIFSELAPMLGEKDSASLFLGTIDKRN